MVHFAIRFKERQRWDIQPATHDTHPPSAPSPRLSSNRGGTRTGRSTAALATETNSYSPSTSHQTLELWGLIRDPLLIWAFEGVCVLPTILGIHVRLCDVQCPIRPVTAI